MDEHVLLSEFKINHSELKFTITILLRIKNRKQELKNDQAISSDFSRFLDTYNLNVRNRRS